MINHDTDFFVEKENSRRFFVENVEKLLNKIKKDRATRSDSLAGKDIKLLRTTEAAVSYLWSNYDNEWRICLPSVVVDYIVRMKDCLDRSYITQDEEYTGTEYFLSICDVEIILKETNQVIYYLLTEFDPINYTAKKSLFSRFFGKSSIKKVRTKFIEAFPSMDRVSVPQNGSKGIDVLSDSFKTTFDKSQFE